MKQILVIADPHGSEQFAFARALKLAKPTGCSIHVLMFHYESVSDIFDQGSAEEPTANQVNFKKCLIELRQQWWLDYLDQNPSGVPVSYQVVWEKYLHDWVVNHCQDHQYDLVVKTGNRSETTFYTPTDWHLFRQSPTPIYSVNHSPAKHNKIVLVALDLATKQPEKQALNQQLTEQAFRLAAQTNATLYCCFCIKVSPAARDLGLVDVSARIAEVKQSVFKNSEAWLAQYDLADKRIMIKNGTPWRVITDLSHQLKAQCIVIGSMGRKGVPGKLIGNTAEKVIQHAKSDLLVLGAA